MAIILPAPPWFCILCCKNISILQSVSGVLTLVYQSNFIMQVIWGGRWQDGSACSTGEEVEQINSHMSRCGNTTKYMLPESEWKPSTRSYIPVMIGRYTQAGKQIASIWICFLV